MATEDISTLISNARSRAAVLSSLDNAFETKLSGAHRRPLNEVELSTNSHNDRDSFIDNLQELLRGTGVYSRQKIEDQIKGKTIVLQHLRSGSTNAMDKLKKAHKGQRRSSNADLKKRKQIKVSSITEEDVRVLRGLFAGYMAQVCGGCKNTGQLQARLLTCEMTGATVSVVETVDPSLRQYLGRKGTVVGESMNCFHVAYEVVKTDKVIQTKKKVRKRRRREPEVVKVERGGDERQVTEKAKMDEKDEATESAQDIHVAEGIGKEADMLSLVVVTVIKEKCRLAMSLDAAGGLAMAGSGGGGIKRGNMYSSGSGSGSETAGLMCIIHGKQYLPSLETNFNSLSSAIC